MILRKFIYTATLFLTVLAKGSGAEEISFEKIGVQDGLTQLSVMSIAQDQLGAMWFGTREGISCYDGYGITPFRPTLFKHNLPGNIVHSIVPADDNRLFMVCDDNLLYYDLKYERFERIAIDNVQSIARANEGIWVITLDRIYKVHGQELIIDKYCRLSKPTVAISGVPVVPVSLIKEISGQRLLIGNPDGLFQLGGKQNIMSVIRVKRVVVIFQDSKLRVWVGTEGHGLFLLDNNLKTIRHFQNDPSDVQSISSNDIRTVCEDNNGTIWVGTFLGLNKFDDLSGRFSVYKQTDGRENTLSHNSIKALLCDQQGTIWVGSYYGGVNYFNPDALRYKFYPTIDKDNKILGSPLVTRITEDNSRNIYIATDGSGVIRLENPSRKSTRFTQESGILSHNSIRSMFFDSTRNHLYLGSHFEGLDVIDLSSKRLIKRYTVNNGLSNNGVYSLAGRGNDLFVSTQNGVFVVDMTNGKLSPLEESIVESKGHWINPLYVDSKGNLWTYSVGDSRIVMHNFATGGEKVLQLFGNSNKPISVVVTDILEDSDGDMWFSTNGTGVFHYDTKKDYLSNLSIEKCGLLSDYCYALTELASGNILISTNKGLSRIVKPTGEVVSLRLGEGCPLVAVNEGNGLYVASDGEVFWGGINGVVSFFEHQIHNIAKPSSIYLKSLEVNNRIVHVDDSTGILKHAPAFSSKIKLRTTDTNINIWFGTTNYVKSNSCLYEYRMVGINDRWEQCEGNKISFLSLPRGDFKLEIRGRYSYTGIFTDKVSLEMRVVPPFYLSYVAIVFYILLLLAVVYSLINIYFRQMKLRSLLELRQREKERIEEVNRSKLQFFTNVSHEFRTPLMLITAQLESLTEMNVSKPFSQKVNSVYRSAIKMNDLLTELLDFRKQEQGFLEIHVTEVIFSPYIEELLSPFANLTVKKDIKLTFANDCADDMIWIDQVQFRKVVNNLISNAVKFTPRDGEIKVQVSGDDDNLVLEVFNDGISIPEEHMENIFNPFFRVDNGNYTAGTGIGLAMVKGIVDMHGGEVAVCSKEGHGTTFRVTLRRGDAHFTFEQKRNVDYGIENYITDMNMVDEGDETENISHNNGIIDHTMLIVDDNEEILSLLTASFSPFYMVKTARNGKEALEKLLQEEPDIIITDLMMSEMNGMELLIKLKSNLETSHIPVVMITADTAEQSLIQGLQYGADDYITKPFSVKYLILRCNNIVRNRHNLQSRFNASSKYDLQLLAHNKLDYDFMQRILQVVEENMDNERFAIDEIAQKLSINRKKIYAKIKGITGMTPNDLILNIKLKRSAQLLMEAPEMTISEISYKLGFNTPQYFSKCFKEHYKKTPSEFRAGE